MGVGDKSYDYFCVNSGFNCRYPEQEEIEDGIGCCYAWSCPLCNSVKTVEQRTVSVKMITSSQPFLKCFSGKWKCTRFPKTNGFHPY